MTVPYRTTPRAEASRADADADAAVSLAATGPSAAPRDYANCACETIPSRPRKLSARDWNDKTSAPSARTRRGCRFRNPTTLSGARVRIQLRSDRHPEPKCWPLLCPPSCSIHSLRFSHSRSARDVIPICMSIPSIPPTRRRALCSASIAFHDLCFCQQPHQTYCLSKC